MLKRCRYNRNCEHRQSENISDLVFANFHRTTLIFTLDGLREKYSRKTFELKFSSVTFHIFKSSTWRFLWKFLTEFSEIEIPGHWQTETQTDSKYRWKTWFIFYSICTLMCMSFRVIGNNPSEQTQRGALCSLPRHYCITLCFIYYIRIRKTFLIWRNMKLRLNYELLKKRLWKYYQTQIRFKYIKKHVSYN